MPAPRVLLLDGTGVLYRAFFAIVGLATRDGLPTNALFGFIRMLRQLAQLQRPTHWAVVFDGGTPPARLALLDSYKAQRPPMPDALKRQLPLIDEYLERAQIPAIRRNQEEADDVLASLAAWALPEAEQILLATSDKDLYQLVNDKTFLIAPSKAGQPIGRAEVREKTGVYPEQIVEWLALTGDAVDNIPGVPGLGPKTAARLLQDFGGLMQVWAHPDNVASARIRAALLDHRPQIEKNLALIRLNRALDCAPGWAAMEIRPEQPDRMLPFYDKMEFHSLARDLQTAVLL